MGRPSRVVGEKIVGADVVGPAAGERVIAVDIVVERLVETHAAHVHSELQSMIAGNLAEAVGPLEAVADLGQLAFRVIADGEAAVGGDEGHAFVIGAQVGSDAVLRIGGIGKAVGGRHSGAANVLDELRVLRMVVIELSFAEVSEAGFVDHGGSGSPGLAEVELLVARAVIRIRSRARLAPAASKLEKGGNCVSLSK